MLQRRRLRWWFIISAILIQFLKVARKKIFCHRKNRRGMAASTWSPMACRFSPRSPSNWITRYVTLQCEFDITDSNIQCLQYIADTIRGSSRAQAIWTTHDANKDAPINEDKASTIDEQNGNLTQRYVARTTSLQISFNKMTQMILFRGKDRFALAWICHVK